MGLLHICAFLLYMDLCVNLKCKVAFETFVCSSGHQRFELVWVWEFFTHPDLVGLTMLCQKLRT